MREPFGVTNGVACFQRVIDEIIQKENLHGTFAYIDNLTICGGSKEEHDRNLDRFYKIAKEYNFTFNEEKSEIYVTKLALLGYLISKGEIRPDPDRLRALLNLPAPEDPSSLKRILGFFSYYAQWVPNYAEKSKPLNKLSTSSVKSLKLNSEELGAFRTIKQDIVDAVKATIDDNIPFLLFIRLYI